MSWQRGNYEVRLSPWHLILITRILQFLHCSLQPSARQSKCGFGSHWRLFKIKGFDMTFRIDKITRAWFACIPPDSFWKLPRFSSIVLLKSRGTSVTVWGWSTTITTALYSTSVTGSIFKMLLYKKLHPNEILWQVFLNHGLLNKLQRPGLCIPVSFNRKDSHIILSPNKSHYGLV